MENFGGKTILVTGGTGTFGTAVVQRFLQTDIAEIRIFSRDEKKQEDQRIHYSNSKLKFFLGDVRSLPSCQAAMQGVDYVFHAAALKQVPSCEFFPMEAIMTNAIGADNVMQAAQDAGVQKCIVLSTDKAAYPVNAMGMTKALMEKLMVSRSKRASEKGMTLCATRYGNVMASRGSVIPLMIGQILQGKPLTVTDPTMTRFMMLIEEAVELVLFAFAHGKSGDLFVKKAVSARIDTVAEALLKIFNASNPIHIIGVRHGEKMYETLLTREEMASAEDMGHYFRVPADERDNNYHSYVEEGNQAIKNLDDYHSHNIKLLNVDELCELLMELDVVKEGLEGKVPL
jgi:UDP-N-acetylglucosamine 4,6-dehydratase/5-epimerase